MVIKNEERLRYAFLVYVYVCMYVYVCVYV